MIPVTFSWVWWHWTFVLSWRGRSLEVCLAFLCWLGCFISSAQRVCVTMGHQFGEALTGRRSIPLDATKKSPRTNLLTYWQVTQYLFWCSDEQLCAQGSNTRTGTWQFTTQASGKINHNTHTRTKNVLILVDGHLKLCSFVFRQLKKTID